MRACSMLMMAGLCQSHTSMRSLAENAFLAGQRMQQDAITAAPQQAAAAMGMVKKQQTEMDNAGYKASNYVK